MQISNQYNVSSASSTTMQRSHVLTFLTFFASVLYQTRAIVLRTVKYGESSLIVDMYTEQKGHQTFIVHSVRKAKATTPPAYLQLMSLVDMVAYHKDHRKIHHVKEVRLDYAYQSIPFDMRKSSVITCLAEITSRTITTSYPQPDLFHFLHEELVNYDKPDEFDRDFMIRYLVSLTSFLGFGMELPENGTNHKYLDLMEGTLVSIRPIHDYVMMPTDLSSLKVIMAAGNINRADVALDIRRRLIDQIITYYQLHVETLRDVQSLKILRELL